MNHYVQSNDNPINYKVNDGNYKVYEQTYVNSHNKPSVLNTRVSVSNQSEYTRGVNSHSSNEFNNIGLGKIISSTGLNGGFVDNRSIKYGSTLNVHETKYNDRDSRGTRYTIQNGIDYKGTNASPVSRNYYVK